MEAAITRMTGHKVNLIASGRTDAGVHAVAQVANFRTSTGIPPQGFMNGLNSMIMPGIAVIAAEEADPEFHARTWAKGKEYLYRIVMSGCRLPLLHRRAWVINKPVDIKAMKDAAAFLTGTHDFISFAKSGSSVKTTVRTISRIDLETVTNPEYTSLGLEEIRIKIRADGFLRCMVRNLVGFLADTGLGLKDPATTLDVLASKDRKGAGSCAPAGGLYLNRVFY